MSRRRSSKSLFEELAEQFEDLPLAVGVSVSVILALVGWALPLIFPSQGLNLSGSFAIIARYLLWLLAFMVLLSALFGATRRWIDRRRFDSNIGIDQLTWSQFEGYLAEYFRRQGSTVTYRGGTSPDGGVDLVVDDAAGRRIVQAKQWKARRVGVVPLRALWGVLGDEKAQGAVFVTSGDFTSDALSFAKGKRLELIDGTRLRRLIAELKGSQPPGVPAFGSVPERETCPQCRHGQLERRLARRGSHAGSYFLGCSRYPQCHYTRNI